MAKEPYSVRQLLEMRACTGCAVCADVCPAVGASGRGELSGLYRLEWQRRAIASRSGWRRLLPSGAPPGEAMWGEFAETVYRCTLCGNCQEVCPAGLRLRELWLSLRSELGGRGSYPGKVDLITANLAEAGNVFGEDQEDRLEWVEDLNDPPEDQYLRDEAEVIYFTGCVASFFPLAQQIPAALAAVFESAKVDFAILGEDEWCCGFPLLGAGKPAEAKRLIEHNLEAVRERGASEIVFACPSCYMFWREHYPPEFRLSHTTQFLDRLAGRGRLPLRPLDMTVTYHDPCDLGRQARIFEEPRRLIASLPGVRLVEMAHSREACRCCGGGGNLEMIDAELSTGIARQKVEEAMATGAEAVVTACQQCVRTMATYTRRNQLPLQVLDISQLVAKAVRG